ncbi:MAG: NADH-quinone oxidoreductase subunit H, partial [Anaplasma sp.]|nr:NADH-quinone oxidoreductase subunit H [Anaplasma sp.]
EYANMILVSAMMVVLFLGGWYPPLDIRVLYFIPGFVWFCFKVFLLLFCFIWVRSTVPRYRYDQLMRLGWKVFLPFSFAWVMVISGVLLWFKALPGMQNLIFLL